MPTVAVVGRPNVGKSTLFNKLIGKRLSIVEDTPGVTRDRIYSKCEWRGTEFTLIDTGGIESGEGDEMFAKMRRQAEIAIDNADVIIFLTDAKSGVTPGDADVAAILRRCGKPVILCVNKCDGIGKAKLEIYDFYNLGLGDPIAVSAVHGHGSGELLDAAIDYFQEEYEDDYDEEYIKVAVIGRPNAGKSSLINKILGEERMIVSPTAGTTRDAVDTAVIREEGKYIFIDTAGIRRKSKVNENIERYSVLRAYMAVDRADVCVIMIDALEGFAEQDSKIAGYAHEQGKGCIIAVNKWDAYEKDGKSMDKYTDELRQSFGFMSYAPFIFISAKTGKRVDKLFGMITEANIQNGMRVSTGTLNDVLAYAVTRVQPPTDRGKRLKIYYMTQPSTKPPTFVIFVNNAELFHFSYRRYIENQLRQTFGFEGTPIRFIIRERGKDDVN